MGNFQDIDTLILLRFILTGLYFWAGVLFLGFWRSVADLKQDSKKYLYFGLLNFILMAFSFSSAWTELSNDAHTIYLWSKFKWILTISVPILINFFIIEMAEIHNRYRKFIFYIYAPISWGFCVLFFIPDIMITNKITLYKFDLFGYQYSHYRSILGVGTFIYAVINATMLCITLVYWVYLKSKDKQQNLFQLYFLIFMSLAIAEIFHPVIANPLEFNNYVGPTFWSVTIAIFIILMAFQMFLEVMTIGRQAERQNETLSTTNEEITFLMGTISHDIKGPLLSIRGFTELLSEAHRPTAEKLTHYANRIHINADHIKLLLKDLANYAKIGRIDDNIEHLSLDQCIKQAISILSLKERYPKVKIYIEGETSPILGSSRRVKEIIINLLENSLKYLPDKEGNIYLHLSQTKQGALIRCEDNGPGIPQELHERVFKKFFRHNPKQAGTGMGLPIVKKIIETYHGRVWIDPHYKSGTSICVLLPNLENFLKSNTEETLAIAV